MSLRHALLGALADHPRTGYGLLKHFDQSFGYAWAASHSQIYPELARLLGDGLIREEATGARGSRTYAVTEAGLAEVRRWLRETGPDRRVRSDAALRVFFLWLLEPEECVTFLEGERAYLRDLLARFESIRAEDPVLHNRKQRAFRLALEGGIGSVRARLAWIDEALVKIRSPEW